MIKKRFLSMLVLLAAVATGAMAQTTYKVSVKEGTEDATSWTIAPPEATTTGVAQGTQVTATYGGVKKVKSVKAVKKAAAWDGTITAQLAAKLAYTGGEIADFTDATADLTTMTWAVGEHIAILYEVSGTKKVADAEITAVDGTTGAATIEFTVEAGTPDDTPCTLVYPYDAAKDDHTGVKDAATLLAAQDGTLSANLDVRVGAGTIQTATPGLTVTTQPAAQFAIFKFTLQDLSAAAKSATEFKVSDNSGNVITTVTSGSASGELYVALPVMAAGTYWFNATIGSKPYIAKATTAAATVAGKYYLTTVKMATIGDVILSDGKFAARSSTGTNVAMIAYLGSSTGVAGYTHGLALALSDVSANKLSWDNTYGNNAGKTAAEWCSDWNTTKTITGGTWMLPSVDQWNKMIDACKNVLGSKNDYRDLRDGFSGISGASNMQSAYYWSSTKSNSYEAWYCNFLNGNWEKDYTDYYCMVRACLAF